MRITDKLTQYKIRYKRWRAETGSPEWHELTAMLRAYAGDDCGAWIHSFMAGAKRLLKTVFEALREFVTRLEEARRSFPEPT